MILHIEICSRQKWDVNWENFWVNLMTALGVAGREQRRGSPERNNKEDCDRSVSQSVCEFVKTAYLQPRRHYLLRYVSKQDNNRSEKSCNCQPLEIEIGFSHWQLAFLCCYTLPAAVCFQLMASRSGDIRRIHLAILWLGIVNYLSRWIILFD